MDEPDGSGLKFVIYTIKGTMGRIKWNSIFALLLVCQMSMAQHLSLVTEHMSPYQIANPKQKVTGLSTEIVESVLARTSFRYDIAANPWSVSYNQALKEPNVCIYSIAYIPYREPLFQWVGQIASSPVYYYSLQENNIDLRTFNDSLNYRVAVVDQDVTHHYLEQMGFEQGKNLYAMKNYDSLVMMLNTKPSRVDLVVLNDELLRNRLNNEHEMKNYRKHPVFTDLTYDFFLACSLATSSDIVQQLSHSLESIKSDGSLDKIKQKWQPYFGQPP